MRLLLSPIAPPLIRRPGSVAGLLIALVVAGLLVACIVTGLLVALVVAGLLAACIITGLLIALVIAGLLDRLGLRPLYLSAAILAEALSFCNGFSTKAAIHISFPFFSPIFLRRRASSILCAVFFCQFPPYFSIKLS